MSFIDVLNNMGNAVGDFVNRVTGKTASQNFNAQEAQKQRDFEEKMSNSAYTRAVDDMKNAGLNPSQMYNNGGSSASTPSGAAASSGVTANPSIIQGISSAVNSIGYMASSMNSRNEQKYKLQAYEKANEMLTTALRLARIESFQTKK